MRAEELDQAIIATVSTQDALTVKDLAERLRDLGAARVRYAVTGLLQRSTLDMDAKGRLRYNETPQVYEDHGSYYVDFYGMAEVGPVTESEAIQCQIVN